jgi:hypothetical protein
MRTFFRGNTLKKTFTLSRAEATVSDPAVLMAQIVRETGSEAQAQSILRSIERIGTDPSVLSYDMTLETRRSRTAGVLTGAWRVRAYRSGPSLGAP